MANKRVTIDQTGWAWRPKADKKAGEKFRELVPKLANELFYQKRDTSREKSK